MTIGRVYYRDRSSGINLMDIGIAEGLEISGDTSYDLAENLSVFDPSGESPLMVAIKSPRKECSLRVRYVRPENERFVDMLEKVIGVYHSLVKARQSGQDVAFLIFLGTDAGNRACWLVLQGFPMRVSMRIDPGVESSILIDVSLRLTVGEYGESVHINRVSS